MLDGVEMRTWRRPWLMLLVAVLSLGMLGLGSAHALPLRMINSATPTRVAVTAANSSSQQARDLFRAAHNRAYRFKGSFPGYLAEVSINFEQRPYHGLVRITPDYSVQVINISNAEVEQMIATTLSEELRQRQPQDFDTFYQDSTFDLQGNTSQGAVQVAVTRSDHTVTYQIQNNLIQQMRWQIGEQTVVISHTAWIRPVEGVIPQVTRREVYTTETGELIQQTEMRDDYNKIGPYYFLARRDIRYGSQLGPKQKPIADVSMIFNDFLPLMVSKRPYPDQPVS
jgi:hypothetical protein